MSGAAQLSITAETIIAWRPLRLNRVLSPRNYANIHRTFVCLQRAAFTPATQMSWAGSRTFWARKQLTISRHSPACAMEEKWPKPVRPLDPRVGLCAFASRAERPGERRTRTRVSAADPACRIGGANQPCRKQPRNRCHPIARLTFKRRAPSNALLCLPVQALRPDEPCREQLP